MPLTRTRISNNITTSNIPSGRRNLIINGAMQVAQRGTSFASPSGGDYLLDRFLVYTDNDGDETISRSTDVPSGQGFYNSLKIDITGADTSIAAGQYLTVDQVIEGSNVAYLFWGTSNARSVTVSFWVKSTLTGTYCYSIRNSAYNRSYVEDFTINSANTWEKKTFTIAGDTTGTWLTDGVGQIHQISVAMGTTFIGNAGWQTGNIVSTSNQVNLMNSTSNEFYITGWQVEEGSVATPFDHQPFSDELARCQRYYVRFVPQGTYTNYGLGLVTTSTDTEQQISLPVPMRSEPVLDTSTPVGDFRIYEAGTRTVTGFSQGNFSNLSTAAVSVTCSGGGMTVGRACKLQDNATKPNNYIAFNAELL